MARQLQLIRAIARPRPKIPGQGILDPSVTTLRVRPADLDIYLHVNNGAYLPMMDVARTHYIGDLGGFPALRERRWYPVVAAQTVTYRRSLTLGQRFEITTRVVGWDERVVYLEQVFTRGDDLCARGLVAGRFLTRGTGERVPAPQVAELLDPGSTSPEIPADVAGWAQAIDVAHRV
ncbi:acyl-CoA thioesterase [Ornithinimicrobium cryptoxanthini]|uniref:acyl-CoA thioesterase n=1 Tax=Ornithinimicrobium cryptoxanthini TaxID=2934161 RepID=UPI002119638C|nr:thioesterase family protein [Ornithinimicrobium cryptoxanthini]